MNEDEIIELQDIFFSQAPYGYVLTVEKKKRKFFLGSCCYDDKICKIYGPDSFDDAVITMLHEIAHARIQHKNHSDVWEKEFVRLLKMNKISKESAAKHGGVMGPNMKEYING